jgi:glycosyltransferase involved in cell wall biosynthesis
MTVIQLISSGGYYGAESMLVTLSRALCREGHSCVVTAFRDSRRAHLEVAEEARIAGLPVETVDCRGRWDWRVIAEIRQLIRRYGARLLHTHGYKADAYGLAAAYPHRVAVVSTCHNWPDPSPLMRAYGVFDRLILKWFDGVAAASEPVAAILRRCGIGAAHLPNGVEVERFHEAAPALRNVMPAGCNRLVGFVGRFVAAKGGAVLLEAARAVVAVRPATAFVFVGEGPCLEEWRATVARYGIARNVVFVGARRDMPEVYASLDILTLPSFSEALPMCLLEGMAMGLPVIATNVGSVRRAVEPEVTGLLLEPGDPDGLAEAVLRLLDDEEFAARLGARARQHIREHYSAGAMADAYLDLYSLALMRNSRRRERDAGRL